MSKQSTGQKNSKTKTENGRDAAITVAIIALIGTVITAIFSSPVLTALLDKWMVTPLPTNIASTTPLSENTPSSADVLKSDGNIAFLASNNNQNSEIYLINSQNKIITNLTNNTSEDGRLKWSPDGKKIAFMRFIQQGTGLYIMNSDGSNQTLLADNSAMFSYDWSPDSKNIAFGDNSGTYIVDVNTKEIRILTSYILEVSGISNPISWSPDGTKLALSAYPITGNNLDIFLANPNGTEITNITNDVTFEFNVKWSPDGQHIAVMTEDEVFIVNRDGNGKTVLYTEVGAFDGYNRVNWSPDSRTLIFDNEFGVIRTINIDGSGLVEVPVTGKCPSWSPDGTTLGFISTGYSVKSQDLYIISESGLEKLTENLNIECFSWQP